MNEQTPALYIDVGLHDFREAFRKMRPDNFTYAGLTTLYDYLVELADDCGTSIELDVVGLCCDFIEYESLADYREQYDDGATMESIQDHFLVIRIDDDAFITSAH